MTRYYQYSSPFIFDQPYTIDKKDVFFGRKQLIEEVSRVLNRTNLLVIYGPIGTGKSSIAQCGLAKSFLDWNPHTIYRNGNFVESFKICLEKEVSGIEPDLIKKLFGEIYEYRRKERKLASIKAKLRGYYVKIRLNEAHKETLEERQAFKHRTAAVLDLEASKKSILADILDSLDSIQRMILYKPVFVFDQLEELFIDGNSEEVELMKIIFYALKKTADFSQSILCIQDDFFSHLIEFEDSIPNLLNDCVLVDNVDRADLFEIIQSNFQYYNINQFHVPDKGSKDSKEKLEAISPKGKTKRIDLILDHLEKNKKWHLPFLQLYLNRLYIEDFARSYPDKLSELKQPRTTAYFKGQPLEFTEEEIISYGNIEKVLKTYIREVNDKLVEKNNQITTKEEDSEVTLKFLKYFVNENGTSESLKVELREDSRVNREREKFLTIKDKDLKAAIKIDIWHSNDEKYEESVGDLIKELLDARILIKRKYYIELSHNLFASVIRDIPVEISTNEFIRRKVKSDFDLYKRNEEKNELDNESYLTNYILDNFKLDDILLGSDNKARTLKKYWAKSEEFRQEEKKQRRKKRKRKEQTRILGALLIIIAIGLFAIFYLEKKKSHKILNAFRSQIVPKNPTLAFQLLDYLDLEEPENTILPQYGYMVNRLKIRESVLHIHKKDRDTLKIFTKRNIYSFNKDGMLLKNRIFDNEGLRNEEILSVFGNQEGNLWYLTKRLKQPENINLPVIDNQYEYQVYRDYNSDGQVVGQGWLHDDSKNLTFLNNGKFLFVRGSIPDNQGRITDSLYEFDFEMQDYQFKRGYPQFGKEIKMIKVTDSGDYLMAANENGFVYVFKVEGADFVKKVYRLPEYQKINKLQFIPEHNKIYIGADGIMGSVDFDESSDRQVEFESSNLKLHKDTRLTILNFSANNETLLSGWEDGAGILIKRPNKLNPSGKTQDSILDVLLLGIRSPVTFGEFVSDSLIVTGYQSGDVAFWSLSKTDKIKDSLLNFSPYEINVELGQENSFASVYSNNNDFEEKVKNLINYANSIPFPSIYHTNEHREKIENSIKELKKLFEDIKRSPDWVSMSDDRKKQIFDSRYELVSKQYFLNTKSLNFLEEKYALQKEELLLKTEDVYGAVNLAARMQNDFDEGENIDYAQVVRVLGEAVDLLERFKEKHLDNPIIKRYLGRVYGSLTWFSLYTGEYNKSIQTADKAFKLDKEENDWINTNYALAHLFKKDFEKAKEVYMEHKDEYFSNNVGQSFKVAFLNDFEALENDSIIRKSDSIRYAFVNKIRGILSN